MAGEHSFLRKGGKSLAVRREKSPDTERKRPISDRKREGGGKPSAGIDGQGGAPLSTQWRDLSLRKSEVPEGSGKRGNPVYKREKKWRGEGKKKTIL